MINGILILIISMILSIAIRKKAQKNKSCFLAKSLPFVLMFAGGFLAAYVVYLEKG